MKTSKSTTMKVKVNIVENILSPSVKEEMWQLYRPYYNYSKAYFMQRIQKNDYYSFYRVKGELVGFTGLRVSRANVDGEKQLLIYFGQTVIHDDFRGKSLIPVTGIKLCMKFWRELLQRKLYFWADALTYKAYLVFAKSVDEMYPSIRYPMKSLVKNLIDFIGDTYYQGTYSIQTGTVQKDTVWVNDTTTQIPIKYQSDLDIRFYQQANPLYMEGHGLITLAPMNRKNIWMLIYRYFRKAMGWKAIDKHTSQSGTVVSMTKDKQSAKN